VEQLPATLGDDLVLKVVVLHMGTIAKSTSPIPAAVTKVIVTSSPKTVMTMSSRM